MTHLTPEDILRIGPEVVEQLRLLLPFEKGFCWVPGPTGGSFPPVDISKRQRERAEEALSGGMPFWDMVGSSVIIPVPCSLNPASTVSKEPGGPATRGAFVLSGISRTVGPEEPDRWLPLLCSWIDTVLRVRRREMLSIRHKDDLPAYIVRAVTETSGDTGILNVLHLRHREGRSATLGDCEKLIAIIENFLIRTSKRHAEIRLELSGLGPRDLWIMIHGLKEPDISASLRQLINLPGLKTAGMEQAFVHTFHTTPLHDNASAADALARQVASTEETARVLGMPLFSEAVLEDLENRFGCSGTKQVLLSGLSNSRGAQYAAAFATLPRIPEAFSFTGDDCFDHACLANTGNCVLFIKKVNRKDRLLFDLRDWGGKIQEMVATSFAKAGITSLSPVGVAATWQRGLKSTTACGAAFWAYVHAFMLDTGESIVSDAVTWQVRGDELIASGALREACRAFRQALKLDESSAEIWNSLGVCMAQLGRKREALKAFTEASRRNPRDFMAFYNLCGVQHALKNYSDAEASCRRAIEISSRNPMALMKLGQVLLDADRAAEACEYLERAVAAHEAPPATAWRMLGTALWRQDRWPEAKHALEKALKLKPDDTAARARLALGYAEHENDHTTARRLAQGLMLKSKTSPELKRLSARLSAVIAESSLDKK